MSVEPGQTHENTVFAEASLILRATSSSSLGHTPAMIVRILYVRTSLLSRTYLADGHSRADYRKHAMGILCACYVYRLSSVGILILCSAINSSVRVAV